MFRRKHFESRAKPNAHWRISETPACLAFHFVRRSIYFSPEKYARRCPDLQERDGALLSRGQTGNVMWQCALLLPRPCEKKSHCWLFFFFVVRVDKSARTASLKNKKTFQSSYFLISCAGKENRTPVSTLARSCSTTKPYPHHLFCGGRSGGTLHVRRSRGALEKLSFGRRCARCFK